MRSTSSLLIVGLVVMLTLPGLLCSNPLQTIPTPTGTDTPSPPTATRTPRPTFPATRTHNLAATQLAEYTDFIRSEMDILEIPSDVGQLGWIQPFRQDVRLSGSDFVYKGFLDDPTAADFVIQTQMSWETDGWPICGFLFRADEGLGEGDYYAINFLRFSGLPAWDIEYFHDGEVSTIVTERVRFSHALEFDNGEVNEIMLVANGNKFEVYVNRHYEGQYFDYSNYLDQGHFAFMGSQPAGSTTCTFEYTWIWVYK